MPTLAVVSHKGGAGKTAVAANLAGVLATTRPVLAVDVDPSGGLGAALGIPPGSKPSLYEVITGQADAASAVINGYQQLSVIPADLDLAGSEIELPRDPAWRETITNLLSPLRSSYGITILDTPPGLGVLSFAAVSAASAVIVVCPPEFMAFRALPDVLDMAGRAGAAVLGIVPTFAQRTTRHAREVAEALAGEYPKLLLPPIPRRVAVQDAALAGQPVSTYMPSSDVAGAFQELAKEVLHRAPKN
jgi:chromosome partitioning protein